MGRLKFSVYTFLTIACLSLFFFTPLFLFDTRAQNLTTDEILLKFRPSASFAERLSLHRQISAQLVGKIGKLDVDIVRVDAKTRDRIVRHLISDRRVLYAEPNYIAYTQELTNDPGIVDNIQWGMYKAIVAGRRETAWNLGKGNAKVKVAVVDTGVDQDHEDLTGKIVDNRNCTYSSTVDDLYGHGTHVAGIIAASTNNGIGVAGLGYQTTIVNAKALSDNGSGYYSWIADCIVWATDNGAQVINMSLGGSSYSKTLEEAVNYAYSKGVVLVAAAGNSNSSTTFYPAGYGNVVSVAATDENDNRANFSNWGRWVDVAAPGVSVYSTLPNHSNAFKTLNYGYLSGTSMATPHVAGLAALILGNSYLTNSQAVETIFNYADRISGSGYFWQYGRINAYRSLAATPLILSDDPTTTPTPTSAVWQTPTPTVIPTATPTPSPLPTQTPTQTPTPTIVPSSTPTPSSTPNDPYSRVCRRYPWWCERYSNKVGDRGTP